MLKALPLLTQATSEILYRLNYFLKHEVFRLQLLHLPMLLTEVILQSTLLIDISSSPAALRSSILMSRNLKFIRANGDIASPNTAPTTLNRKAWRRAVCYLR